MNIILFYSSIAMLLNFIIIFKYYYKNYEKNKLYLIICIIAIIASILAILNHGKSLNFLKYLDRIFILFAIIFHLIIIESQHKKYVILSILFYIIAKCQTDIFIKSYFHLLAHFTIVIYHIILFSTNSFSFSI